MTVIKFLFGCHFSAPNFSSWSLLIENLPSLTLEARNKESQKSLGIDSDGNVDIWLHEIHPNRFEVTILFDNPVNGAVTVSDRLAARKSPRGLDVHSHRLRFEE